MIVALRYKRVDDVHLAPAYDMVTTAAYPDYAKNPPGISFMGKKTWDPGKKRQTFICATFGLPSREQASIVEQIGAAMPDMLLSCQHGIAGLRDKRTYALGATDLGDAFKRFSGPKPGKKKRQVIGRAELLPRR